MGCPKILLSVKAIFKYILPRRVYRTEAPNRSPRVGVICIIFAQVQGYPSRSPRPKQDVARSPFREHIEIAIGVPHPEDFSKPSDFSMALSGKVF